MKREILDGQLAPGPVDGERVGLPAGAIKRKHEQAAQPLPERMLVDQDLELGREPGVPAERELGLDSLLRHREPELLEALDVAAGEVLVLEVGQRATAPERLGLTERRDGLLRLRVINGALPFRGKPFEPRQVELLRLARNTYRSTADEAMVLVAVLEHSSKTGYLDSRARSAASPSWPAWSASSRRSRETTLFASSRSSASSARWRGPPIPIGEPPRSTSIGPRIRNSNTQVTGSLAACGRVASAPSVTPLKPH